MALHFLFLGRVVSDFYERLEFHDFSRIQKAGERHAAGERRFLFSNRRRLDNKRARVSIKMIVCTAYSPRKRSIRK